MAMCVILKKVSPENGQQSKQEVNTMQVLQSAQVCAWQKNGEKATCLQWVQ